MSDNSATVNKSPDPSKPQAYRMGDLLNDWDLFAEEVYDARLGNKPMGIRTGLSKVDEAIGGVLHPGLHSIQGGPGVGKSALALQIAATCGLPALFVTCEQSPMEIMRRITARVTGTYVNNFKNGDLTPDQSRQLVRKAITTCPDLVILDCTRGHAPAIVGDGRSGQVNIYDIADSMKSGSSHILVMIDSLHSWASSAPSSSTEYELLNASIASLIGLSASLECPVVAIAEQPKGDAGKADVLSGAGTRKIGYSAETVISIEKTVPKSTPDKNLEYDITLTLNKNRNGVADQKLNLKFNGALMKFREV